MPRSIRWRLQLWYAAVLLTVVAGFAGWLYYRVRTARFQEMDAELTAAVQYLDLSLRPLLEFDREGQDAGRPLPPSRPPRRRDPPSPGGGLPREPASGWPGPPLGAGEDRTDPPPPRPFPPPRDGGLAELEVPPSIRPAAEGQANAPYFAVWHPDSSLLRGDNLPEAIEPPDFASTPPPPDAWLRQRGDWREAIMRGPRKTRLVVGRPTRREWDELNAFAWQLAGGGVLVLAVGLAGGWLISSRILRPVAAISATASAISATNLSQRINAAQVDRELVDLALVLNAMFARLETAFEQQTRFTADASHELRTPLAILRTHVELALSRPRSAEDYLETLQTCLRAVTRMTDLVEALLTLARADAGKLDFQELPIDLRQLVAEQVTLFRPLAAARQVALTVTLGPATLTGDAGRLVEVVTNLLSNAVQHNRPGGQVQVELKAVGDRALLTIADTGPGIAEADQPHLFERFYRADKARSRQSGGNGLGLAICKGIVEAHGGTIGFRSQTGQGSTFWVRLPIHPAPS